MHLQGENQTMDLQSMIEYGSSGCGVIACMQYLNTGPGGIGGLFLHEKYAHDANFKRYNTLSVLYSLTHRIILLRRLVGWWAHEKGTRLEMKNGL